MIVMKMLEVNVQNILQSVKDAIRRNVLNAVFQAQIDVTINVGMSYAKNGGVNAKSIPVYFVTLVEDACFAY